MKKSKNILKTYFETGDKPTQKHYEDLIDSFQHVDDVITNTDLPENVALKNENNNFSTEQTFQNNITAPIFLGNLIGDRITAATPNSNFQINNNSGQLIAKFDENKNVDIYGNTTAHGHLNVLSNLQINGDVSLASKLVHTEDTDTYLDFTVNQVDLVAGNYTMIRAYGTDTKTLSLPPQGGDIDVVMGWENGIGFWQEGSTGHVGINTAPSSYNFSVGGTSHFSDAATFDSSATASAFLVDAPSGWLVKNTLGNHGVYFDGDETIIQSKGVFSVRADGTSVNLRNTNVDGTLTVDNTIDANGEVSLGWNNSLSLGEDPYKFSISRTTAGLLHTSFRDDYDNPGARIEFVMRHGSTNENVPLYMLGNGESHFQGELFANANLTVNSFISTPTDTNLFLMPRGNGQVYLGNAGNGSILYHYSSNNDGIYTTFSHTSTQTRFQTTAAEGFRFDHKVDLYNTLQLKSSGADGDELLRLGLDGGRDWIFQQKHSGPATTLLLKSMQNKPFWVEATDTHFRNSIDETSHLILNHQSKTAVLQGTLDVNGATTVEELIIDPSSSLAQIKVGSSRPLEFNPTSEVLYLADGETQIYVNSGNIETGGHIKPAGGYRSSDGTLGFNGTFTAGAYSITVKDGLITDAVNIS